MKPVEESPPHAWSDKLRWAARGIARAVRGERNFRVHLTIALVVVIAAAALAISPSQWCLLALCIATVLAAEMFNTAIEHLARAITPEHNASIRDALDMSAGGVLVAALGAALVGAVVFVQRLGAPVEWW